MTWKILDKLRPKQKSLADVLQTERQRYVKGFVLAREMLSRNEPTMASELLISINNDSIPYPYRYLRVDLLSKDKAGKPKPIELRDDAKSGGSQLFDLGEGSIEVRPFVWCAISLILSSEPTDMAMLESWMTKVLDTKDANARGPMNECLAAHSFEPIQKADDGWYLKADLGTAPHKVLIDLLDLLSSQGVKHFVLKS